MMPSIYCLAPPPAAHSAKSPATCVAYSTHNKPWALSTPTSEVLELFRAQANLNSLAVLNPAQQPVGIVHRHSLAEALLKPFANELFARKPISRLMSDDYLAGGNAASRCNKSAACSPAVPANASKKISSSLRTAAISGSAG